MGYAGTEFPVRCSASFLGFPPKQATLHSTTVYKVDICKFAIFYFYWYQNIIWDVSRSTKVNFVVFDDQYCKKLKFL